MSSDNSFNRPIIPRSEASTYTSHRPTPPPIPAGLKPALPTIKTTNDLTGMTEEESFVDAHRPVFGKALTNVDHFISLDPKHVSRRSDSLTSEESVESLPDESMSIPKELPISESMQRRQKEWAERGAAMIVKDVTDKETGKVTKHVMKKGINDFKFGETLGDGSYSTVLLATSIESGKKYAVKILNKEYLIKQKKVKYVNIEKNTLQRLKNTKGIISLFFTFQDETSLYFLLEYAPNGDLLSLMRKHGSVNEVCTKYYAAQIIDALDFMHSKGVIHRDLKPENILLDTDMKAKLTDFGTARLLESTSPGDIKYDLLTRSNSFVGTAEYVSPELLNDSYVDFRCDIWAFGCIVFQMIAGKPPFKANNEYLTFQKVMKVQFAFTAGFPVRIRDLVKNILIKDPDRRILIPQIKAHQFFADVNFNDGSVWENDPPELGPYKISARALQSQVPKVNPSPVPNSITETARQTSTSPKLTPKSSTTSAHRFGSETVSTTKKREVDPRTQRILDNVKKEIYQRNQKRAPQKPSPQFTSPSTPNDISPNPAAAAAAALQHVKQTPNGMAAKSATSSAGSGRIQRKVSGNSYSAGAHYSSPKSTVSSSSFNTRKSSSDIPPMSKVDILWSFYLKNIQERVVKMGDLSITAVKNQNLELKINKSKLALLDVDSRTQKKNTLLSQVVRGGGNVTGFRQDTSDLTEQDYYNEYLVDPENIDTKFRKQPNTDDNASSEGISKLKHFFSKTPNSPTEFIPQSDFVKRMCVLTTFGRCLLFARRSKINMNSELFYDLEYEIDLSQLGVHIKEVVLEKKTEPNEMFVVQTPFKSFVFQTEESETPLWLKSLVSAIKIKNERFPVTEPSINPIANQAAFLAEHEAENQLNDHKVTSPYLTKRSSSFTSQKQKQNISGKLATRPISSGSRMLSRSEQIFRTNK
ncbi:unnamed protein product [Kluyveromyces dobzhanskii CBS 2104]|uniref:non-specific serine/threonine protein kinase n=1 Tax=Kluyveromyces dobzhanskii CBS 2104 TaxID=1427455 RepID=A0A0A8LBB1_9SACH|nr:unnamed protein product [Kluyveromyces dobzhanskii CBS 2104]